MPKKSTNSFQIWRQGSRRLMITILGFCFGMFGILCGMFWEDIFNYMLAKEMALRPDSRVYENWKNPPLGLSLDVYVFNWTNPEDFRDTSTKPILQQLGPYRFTEIPDKVNIHWHPQNASVTYKRKSNYYFDAAGSNGSLDDQITTLNAVALSAAAQAKHWNPVRRKMVDVGLKLYGQEISVIKTVDELLFTGYSDDMINMAIAMPIFGDDVVVPFDRFGWFYTRNGSADLTGIFNIHTGADDISKIGKMHTWNYKKHTGFYDSYCGLTNGSAGEFQSPNLKVNGSIGLFSPDLCRTINLDYVGTDEIENIQGYKYVAGQRSIDNGSLYPENECFCGGECVPSGVMNSSSCRFQSPVFASYPHFYHADPYYVNQVVGMEPSQAKHEFYMTLEPRTGLALEVAARIQVNMLVEPIDGITLFNNVPRTFLPLIWFEEIVRITPELGKELKMISYGLMGGQIFACVCFAIGLILLCWYPIEQLCYGHNSVDMKINHPQNVKYKYKAANVNEQKNAKVEKMPSPDSSPLLEKDAKSVKMLPTSNAVDNVATKTSTISNTSCT